MKSFYVILASIAISLLVGCSQCSNPVNPNSTEEAANLLSSLYQSSAQGCIISGLHYRGGSYDLQRIDSASGKKPIVWGGELAWDGANTVKEAIRAYSMGHIITLMWHAPRPFDSGPVSFRNHTCGKMTDAQWKELMTEGSEIYNKWLNQIDSIAVNFLLPLREAKVPVLWRPYHEMNGEWFWWGNRGGDFAILYRRMWERYVMYHHLDNILWVWNANAPRDIPGDSAGPYESCYPGNEYVDALATDVYNRDWKQSHHDELLKLGQGKLIALGEIGNLPTSDNLDNMNRYAWFMIWNGFTSDKYNSLDDIADVFMREKTISFDNGLK